ncbi:GTP-binding protein [Streptomyces mirabilis]|uniref:GTP-binding protein n=1 Tax=Streptomyces mirabilis TaxID=68239 RepID=UPI00371A7C23
MPSSHLCVVIVGGLHADARRAAVARLLADVPGSVALHHDLATAAAGTVVRTIRDATGIVSAGEAPLVNDCACCALREDLVPELRRLADAGLTRLAVVELWDSVEPKAMAEVVSAAGLRLTSVITAVDPALLLPYLANGDDLAEVGLAAAATDRRTVADTFARQLEYAPVLAVAASEQADDEDRALLAQLHPTARRVPIDALDVTDGEARETNWFAPTRPTAEGWTPPGWEADPVDTKGAAPADSIGPSATDGPRGGRSPGMATEPDTASGADGSAGADTAPGAGADAPEADPATAGTGPRSEGFGSAVGGAGPWSQRTGSALVEAAFAGFDVEAAAAAQHPACALLPAEADEAGVGTLVWHRRRPFHPERLYAALEDLTCAAARSRGRFWLADRPDTLLHWDAAGGALCVESAGPWLASLPDAAWDMVPPVRRAAAALDWHPEHGDCCQHLVFTSPGLDREGLELLLESCLLTDAEYAAGPAAWKRLPPAFDSFLEV